MQVSLLERLKNKKYKNLKEFDEQQQEKLKGLLGGVNVDQQPIYVKVYSVLVDTKADDNNETLWTTRIMFASFFIISDENEILDNFFVPVRPFRIRTTYENFELQKLTKTIFDEILEIEPTEVEPQPETLGKA
jgi:ABC-type long-subunit fatty acid transport system fused permease/ATPase subunit